jgi:hypothetical protein
MQGLRAGLSLRGGGGGAPGAREILPTVIVIAGPQKEATVPLKIALEKEKGGAEDSVWVPPEISVLVSW